jgi:hypothetical protein
MTARISSAYNGSNHGSRNNFGVQMPNRATGPHDDVEFRLRAELAAQSRDWCLTICCQEPWQCRGANESEASPASNVISGSANQQVPTTVADVFVRQV